MYNEFYGFQEKPFSLTPDPHFFYLSSVHRKALAYLTYGLEDKKGFITVTGEIGAGKTMLICAVMSRMDSKTTVSRIINTTVSSIQLLKMIVRDFGINIHSSAKEDLLESLNDFLLKEYALGHNTVIIIDEAQNLASSTLEEIRLLSNLETEKDKLLQIILVGQPELRQTLALPRLKQLRQRITVNYHIAALSDQEVAEYIRHRLKIAGAPNPNLFSEKAMAQIAKGAKGIPRVINIICDAALVTGYVEGKQEINESLVKEVLAEINLDHDEEQPPPPFPSQDKGQTLHQDLEQLCRHYQNKLPTVGNGEQKAKRLQQQIEQLGTITTRLLALEKEFEEQIKQIKKKKEELGI